MVNSLLLLLLLLLLIKTVLKEIDAYDNIDFSFFKAFFYAYFNL
jgi:hypothetical protein